MAVFPLTQIPLRPFSSCFRARRYQHHFYQHRARRSAVTIVEFALVLPVLLMLIMGIMEFAWLGRTQLSLGNAAREGARTAALGNGTSNIKTRVLNAAAPVKLTNDNVTLEFSTDNGANYYALGDSGSQNNAATGSMIRVRINYTQTSLTGFFRYLNNYKHNVSAVMRREAA